MSTLPDKTQKTIGYRFAVQYIGTSFHGWQRQGEIPTVQREIERAVEILWGKHISIEGSGRTDTGVHAYGQVVTFHAPNKFSPEILLKAINAHLPHTIRIVEAKIFTKPFHARFNARAKTYEYRIWNHPVFNPFLIERAWHIPLPLDIPLMRQGAKLLIGEHDFASFATNPGYKLQTTVRTVYSIDIKRVKGLITVKMTANGFLHRMVRNVTGTLVKLGQKKISLDDVSKILDSKNRIVAPGGAPAYGLYLMKVYYGAPYPPHDPRVPKSTANSNDAMDWE